MGLRRTSLVLFILFLSLVQHNIPSVSSQPSSVATNHEALPLTTSKPDVVRFEGKARELAVVIKKGGGGGGRGGGGGGRGGGGGSRSRSRVVPIHTGVGGTHSSSGSRNLGGALCAVGWLSLSVLVGLFSV